MKYSVNITADTYEDAKEACTRALEKIEGEHQRRLNVARDCLQENVESRIEDLLEDLGYNVQTLNDNDLINYHMAVSSIYRICVKDLKVD